jgi:hypothetical protein
MLSARSLTPSHRPSAQITSPTPDMTKPNLIPRKEIANAFYGQNAHKAYFAGCSTEQMLLTIEASINKIVGRGVFPTAPPAGTTEPENSAG